MKFAHRVFAKVLMIAVALQSAQAWSAPLAKVLRSGKGRVDAAYPWPEAYKIPMSGAKKKYSVQRLEEKDLPRVSKRVRESWNVSRFTDLGVYPQDTELSEFQFVVHGLELKALHPSLSTMSFDDFIVRQFNPTVPQGIDFVRYYPYFFHKKTVISASIINPFNTATFGYSGFILSVPQDNYLACSEVDMHTPTDKDFYPLPEAASRTVAGVGAGRAAAAAPFGISELLLASLGMMDASGPFEMRKLYEKHPLRNLMDFLPDSKVDTKGTPARKSSAGASKKADKKDLEMRALLLAMGADDLLGQVGTQSWYNEVALNPVTRDRQSVAITGVFIRAANSPRALEEARARPEIRILLELAEVFDLPVLHIYDGQYYETDVGEAI